MKVVFGTLLLSFILLNSIQFSSQFLMGSSRRSGSSSRSQNQNQNQNQNLPQGNSNVEHNSFHNIREGLQIRLANGNYYVSNGQGEMHFAHHIPTGIITVRQGNQQMDVPPLHGYSHFTSMVGPPSPTGSGRGRS